MPFLISNYTDSAGISHTNSWWVVRTVQIAHNSKTGSFTISGYHSITEYESFLSPVTSGDRSYTIGDSSTFNSTIGSFYKVNSASGYTTCNVIIESYLKNGYNGFGPPDSFFSTATQFSIVRPYSVRMNDNLTQVKLTFDDYINSYTTGTGFTIKVNGSSATISAVSLDSDGKSLLLTIPSVTVADTLTYLYSHSTGNVKDTNSIKLYSITETSIVNAVGGYLMFDTSENSGQIPLVF